MNDHQVNLRLIIDGCLQGNRLSQRKLYEQYYGYGLNVSLRYSKNREEAAEILNDAFLKIFKNLDKFDHAYPFQAWMKRIVVNQAIDFLRSQKNKVKFLGLTQISINLSSGITPTYEEADDLLPILQKLPPKYRMVFNLYVMEEYKHHEIAELLNISASTSRSNLARAKDKLRDYYSKKTKSSNLLNQDMNKAL